MTLRRQLGTASYSVGVAIPTFRRPRELRRALESVLGQSYPADRVLISDDGHQQEVEDLVASYGDRRLIYVPHRRHRGMTDNWNYSMRATECDVVALLEDDNFWRPGHLESALSCLRAAPESVLYHCPHVEAWDDGSGDDESGLEFYKSVFPPWHDPSAHHVLPDPLRVLIDALAGGSINSSTVVVRADALNEVPPFDRRFIMGMDTLMWTRLAIHGGAVYSPYVGVVYTYHGRNVSTERLRTRRATIEARGARRLLAQEVLATGGGLGERVVRELETVEAELAAPISVILGHRSIPRMTRRAAWRAVRERADVRTASRHLQFARLVGPIALRYADIVDSVLSYGARIRLRGGRRLASTRKPEYRTDRRHAAIVPVPPRVLIHVTARGVGGVETHTRDLALGLLAAGARVTLTSQRHLEFDPVSESELLTAGVKFVRPPSSSSLLRARRTLARDLPRRSFDVVIGQGHGGAFSWMRRYVAPGGRMVWHEYWYGVPTRGDQYARYEVPHPERFSWRMRRMVRSVDLIVTGCERAVKNLRRVQRFSGPIEVVPPLDEFSVTWEAEDRRVDRGTTVRAVMVARHGRGKGTVALLDAWDEVRPEGAELHLYGPAEDEGVASRLRAATSSGTGIAWHGPFERQDLASILREADLGLFVSIEEGYGLVVREYMAAGVPFLMTDVGASKELCERNPDCVVIDVGPSSLRAGLSEALSKVRGSEFSRSRLQATYRATYNQAATLRRHAEVLLAPNVRDQ